MPERELSRGTTVRIGKKPAVVVKDSGTVLIVEYPNTERDLVSKEDVTVDESIDLKATSHMKKQTSADDDDDDDEQDEDTESSTSRKTLPCGHPGAKNIQNTSSKYDIQCPRCDKKFTKEEVRSQYEDTGSIDV